MSPFIFQPIFLFWYPPVMELLQDLLQVFYRSLYNQTDQLNIK